MPAMDASVPSRDTPSVATHDDVPSRDRPILVTGSHRSGTTWVGRMIAASPGIFYVHEPFNVNFPSPMYLHHCEKWFHYICDENAQEHERHLRDLVQLKSNLFKRICRSKSLTGKHGLKWQIDQARELSAARIEKSRLLMKDPLALFSTPWLVRTFEFQPVVMIRHPAAFAGSLKRADWKFDYRNLLDQPLLMRDWMEQWRQDIERCVADQPGIIQQATLLWNIIHDVIHRFREQHADWIFLRHEDIAADPMTGFAELFEQLHVPMDGTVRKHIEENSSAKNKRGDAETELLAVDRDSKAQRFTWKNRLTPDEIARIRDDTAEVAKRFYSEEDWEQE